MMHHRIIIVIIIIIIIVISIMMKSTKRLDGTYAGSRSGSSDFDDGDNGALAAMDSDSGKASLQALHVVPIGAGQKRSHFSIAGRYALAIRRNISNLAAKDLGLAILQDVSGQSIAKYEIELGAALIAIHKTFNEQWQL
eukprot:11903628-Karenia_brevis.AAC.1